MSVEYLNHMGSDLEVANDARVSFGKRSEWLPSGTPNDYPGVVWQVIDGRPVNLSKDDANLIGFLARGCRSGDWQSAVDRLADSYLTQREVEEILSWVKRMPTHWTPFAHQVIKLRMKAPVPIRTQCFKSKIGFVENEESRRYIDSTPELFVPEYRSRPEGSIKQGSGGAHPDNQFWQERYKVQCTKAIQLYEDQIAAGIAPEQARFVLPQGVYVNWIWTGSLYAYAEFFNKRADRSHAQGEVADLADQIGEIIRPLFPVSWAALTEVAA